MKFCKYVHTYFTNKFVIKGQQFQGRGREILQFGARSSSVAEPVLFQSALASDFEISSSDQYFLFTSFKRFKSFIQKGCKKSTQRQFGCGSATLVFLTIYFFNKCIRCTYLHIDGKNCHNNILKKKNYSVLRLGYPQHLCTILVNKFRCYPG